MKHYFVLVLIGFGSLFGCGKKPEAESTKIARASYEEILVSVEEKRKSIYNKEFNHAETKKYIFNLLRESIFPAWKGTKWDFNGTSTKPGEGQIACGYFVMTCLEHSGFECDRVKFAQQASSKIVISFSDKKDVKVFRNNDFKSFYDHVSQHIDQLFIVGLDNHVGFVVNDNGKIYAVHSTAWPQGSVVIEPLNTSKVFMDSKVHYTGMPLKSEAILKKWRLSEEIIMI